MRESISINEKERVEIFFKERCISLKIRYKSKKYYEEQASFFAGAMSGLNCNFPYWCICIMSEREIVEY